MERVADGADQAQDLQQNFRHQILIACCQETLATMPKKSKKSKSKRTTLKQKYKVIKKVKEHHKKKAKLLKKSGRKAKAPKDPGIPSQWPFKQELVKEIEWEKQRQINEKKRRKEERRLQQAKVLILLR